MLKRESASIEKVLNEWTWKFNTVLESQNIVHGRWHHSKFYMADLDYGH